MLSNINSAYKELLSKTKDATVLATAGGIIHWDMETMMPPGAVEQRSEQLALLSRLQHKLATDPEIGKLVKNIQTNPAIPISKPRGKTQRLPNQQKLSGTNKFA